MTELPVWRIAEIACVIAWWELDIKPKCPHLRFPDLDADQIMKVMRHNGFAVETTELPNGMASARVVKKSQFDAQGWVGG
jgi:hypothetical protein